MAKFGTSGLRGLVTDLTTELVADHVRAFASSCSMGNGIYIGHDLRHSSPEIAAKVAIAGRSAGLPVFRCGPLPTPALAFAAEQVGAAAIMVTGSHIPIDRNGLKFYSTSGEITKTDETAILSALGQQRPELDGPKIIDVSDAQAPYIRRFRDGFGSALSGMRVGLYAHSAVGRDMLVELLEDLGISVVTLGHSDDFIPVDTEAVGSSMREQLARWAQKEQCAAILSTDADGDRPLMTDETGKIVPGDIIGQIAAKALGAHRVVTPVSSNSGAELGGQFKQVTRCKIGSPFVIEKMNEYDDAVVGYEANGGFLLGFDARGPAGPIPALMTRDAILPMLAVLLASRESSVADIVAAEPPRFTAADRLQDVPTQISQSLVSSIEADPKHLADFLSKFECVASSVDKTDGLRVSCADGRIIHLRPSGNAPELRLYVESETLAKSEQTLSAGLAILEAEIDKLIS